MSHRDAFQSAHLRGKRIDSLAHTSFHMRMDSKWHIWANNEPLKLNTCVWFIWDMFLTNRYHFEGPCGTTLPPALERHESEAI